MSDRTLHAALDLLDRQIVDAEGEPIGKVDDLELDGQPGSDLRVRALLLGPQALGPRLGGRIGALIAGIGRRLAGSDGPATIPVSSIEHLGVVVELRAQAEEVPETRDLEDWLLEHVIERIPGSQHGSE